MNIYIGLDAVLFWVVVAALMAIPFWWMAVREGLRIPPMMLIGGSIVAAIGYRSADALVIQWTGFLMGVGVTVIICSVLLAIILIRIRRRARRRQKATWLKVLE